MAKETKEQKDKETEELKETKELEAVVKEEKPKKEAKKEKAADKKSTKKLNPNKLKKSEKRHFKKYREVEVLVEKGREYSLEEAIDLAKKTSTTKFDSSVEVHMKLGIDPKKGDQQVRGVVILPNGIGKQKKVAVVVTPQGEKEAKAAGADEVGGEELIQKIEKGWLDFDVLVASPEMMGALGKLAKVLGPKGLMPNPKSNTVTQEIAKAVTDIKKGQVEYKNDSGANVHNIVGKVSFDAEKLKENLETYLDAIKRSKPDSAKGVFIKQIYLSTTMGPSVKVKI